ncbi:hypothetical protein H2248_010871 [Termitomyces sp. 'cryptogamus']|nr:hypothetical protein H2248_010871 [Termitomyces sp. 'cryptogamus']
MPKSNQQPNKLLAIPGPVEVTDEVLHAIAQPPLSHVSPEFVSIFQECMQMTRKVVETRDGLPFLISGSGTLGWDQVAANLVEPGENVLVLQTGYFGAGFADCIKVYGGKPKVLKAPYGSHIGLEEIEVALRTKKYKAITITHVDTSTGVLSDVKAIAATVRRTSPDTLVVVDGVCSVGSEELKMDAWRLDVVTTASQKGLGVPPGLCILVASPRAIEVFEARKTPVTTYFASWGKWMPVMRAYDNKTAAYFATPPVNLIRAYHASLSEITKLSPSLDERYRIHKQVSRRVKALADQLGLSLVPKDTAYAANGMTAIYLPDGLVASDVVPRMASKGITIAAGLGDAKGAHVS